MAGIQMSGLVSGLDTASIIDQLMKVEKLPRTKITLDQDATTNSPLVHRSCDRPHSVPPSIPHECTPMRADVHLVDRRAFPAASGISSTSTREKQS